MDAKKIGPWHIVAAVVAVTVLWVVASKKFGAKTQLSGCSCGR